MRNAYTKKGGIPLSKYPQRSQSKKDGFFRAAKRFFVKKAVGKITRISNRGGLMLSLKKKEKLLPQKGKIPAGNAGFHQGNK